jgi:hypothetical protein
MLPLKKVITFVGFMFFLFSENVNCSELNSANKGLPEWANDVVSNCASLDGEYSSIGEASLPNPFNIEFPRLEKSMFSIERFGVETNSVVIKQLPNLNMNATLKNIKGDVLLSIDSNDSTVCDGTWFVSESEVKGGGSESSLIETHFVTKMARSTDGSLIVFHRTHTVRRSWFVMKKSESFDVWYRFFKVH